MINPRPECQYGTKIWNPQTCVAMTSVFKFNLAMEAKLHAVSNLEVDRLPSDELQLNIKD